MDSTESSNHARTEGERIIFGLEPMLLLDLDLLDSEDRYESEKIMSNIQHMDIPNFIGIGEESSHGGQELDSLTAICHALNGQTKRDDTVTSSVNLDFLDIKAS